MLVDSRGCDMNMNTNNISKNGENSKSSVVFSRDRVLSTVHLLHYLISVSSFLWLVLSPALFSSPFYNPCQNLHPTVNLPFYEDKPGSDVSKDTFQAPSLLSFQSRFSVTLIWNGLWGPSSPAISSFFFPVMLFPELLALVHIGNEHLAQDIFR